MKLYDSEATDLIVLHKGGETSIMAEMKNRYEFNTPLLFFNKMVLFFVHMFVVMFVCFAIAAALQLHKDNDDLAFWHILVYMAIAFGTYFTIFPIFALKLLIKLKIVKPKELPISKAK